MAIAKGSKREYFPKVREAREALKEKALDLYNLYERIIEQALDAQNFEVAAENVRWLIEHMPNEEGVVMIDQSAAKPKQVESKGGPSIQIGFQLGGLSTPKALPTSTIDVVDITPEPHDPEPHQ